MNCNERLEELYIQDTPELAKVISWNNLTEMEQANLVHADLFPERYLKFLEDGTPIGTKEEQEEKEEIRELQSKLEHEKSKRRREDPGVLFNEDLRI